MIGNQPAPRGAGIASRLLPAKGVHIRPSTREGDYQPRRRRSQLFFGLASAILAVTASTLAVLVLTNTAQQHGLVSLPTVVTTQAIAQNALIAPEMVQVKQYPTIYRPADAAQSPQQVIGTRAKTLIPVGVPVTLDVLTDKNAPQTISGVLQAGFVGFFLPSNTVLTALPLSLVSPGDHVDLYVANFGVGTNPPNPSLQCLTIIDILGQGEALPQGVISATSGATTESPGLVLETDGKTVSYILYLLANKFQFALTIDPFQACK